MSRQPTQAVLSNPHKPELGVVTVPLPIPMKEYDRTMELLKSLGIGAVLNQDCHINEVTGEWASALHRLKNQSVNVDELDYLVKRLESFLGDEPAQFMAMADKMNLTDMVSLINLTFCCPKATVITDFNNLEGAGRQHYMNLNNGSVPTEELERLDGRATALQLIKSGEGFVTPYGVVFDNGMALEVIYDGKPLPPYLHEESPLALTAKSSSSPNDATQSVWLALPMSKQQMGRALLRGGMFDTSEAEIEVDMDWFTGARDGVLVTKDTAVSIPSDHTLYAHWRVRTSGGDSSIPYIPDKPSEPVDRLGLLLEKEKHDAYLVGFPDGTIRPNAEISRAEVAQILYRLMTQDAHTRYDTAVNAFAGVANTDWYNAAVSTLAAMDILKGRGNGQFDPMAPVSRAEFAVMMARLEGGSYVGDDRFSDISDCWAREEINRAASLGWVKGYDDGEFAPERTMTRAEVVAILNRALGRCPKSTQDLLPGAKTFPDNADPEA